MELYMQNKEHGRMILESVEHGPLIWPTIEENEVTRTKEYVELSATEKIQADYDLSETNIILQGLPSDVYSLVNHHRVAKDLWERVQLLMHGTSLTKQERECKMYDASDNLSPELSKFVTDVKLLRDFHTTNFDQLNAYLEKHEVNAIEVRIMYERNQDPLALVANHQMTPSHFNTYKSSYNNPQFQQQISPSQSPQYGSIHPTQQYSTTYPSTPLAITYPSTPYPNAYSSIIDSSLAVLMFKKGDDPIDAINKMMSFMSTVVTSCFPSTKYQCPKPKKKRGATWFRDKVLLVEAQGFSKVLNEEEWAFLATEAKAVLMANLSSYRSDVLSEDTNSSTQQDGMILSVFEQLSNQVTNCSKVNKDNLIANESLSVQLERYKEQVKLLEERKNVDLSTKEKLIIDDIIQDKNAQFADFKNEINSLKQTLSEQLKKKETLKTTFNVLKHES
nr:hypothetical protein [Tanacetum cinerariifolium]